MLTSDELRDETEDMFRKSLITLFLDNISVLSALEVFYDNALYKSTFYLLTKLCLTDAHETRCSVF